MSYTPLKKHHHNNHKKPLRREQGSIYESKKDKKVKFDFGELFEYFKVLFLRTLGNFLVLSSIFLIAKTFYQPLREEVRYFIESRVEKVYVVEEEASEQQKTQAKEEIEGGGFASILNVDKVEVMVPNDPNFSLVIPKIGANAPVVPNVNAASEEDYLDALHEGVAHVEGTSFPGEGSHIFLFAHSTDYVWNVGSYNAVFYLLYKLEEGDDVNIFYKGKRYVYNVTGSKVVDPSEVEYITRKTSKEFVTLQTCWPPGTTLKRLLIFAERSGN